MHFGSGHSGYVYTRLKTFINFCTDGAAVCAGALNLPISSFIPEKRFFSTWENPVWKYWFLHHTENERSQFFWFLPRLLFNQCSIHFLHSPILILKTWALFQEACLTNSEFVCCFCLNDLHKTTVRTHSGEVRCVFCSPSWGYCRERRQEELWGD